MNREILEQAWKAKMDGDHDRAFDFFQQAIVSDPTNAEAHRELGLIYYGIKRDAVTASQLIQKSMLLEDCPDGHFYLALTMESLNHKIEARSEFLLALEGYGGDKTNAVATLALFYYGEFLAGEGEFEEAEKYMKMALLIEPECEQFLSGIARLQECIRSSDAEVNAP